MVIVRNDCAGFEQEFEDKNSKAFKNRLLDIENKVKNWNSLGGKTKRYNIVKIVKDNKVYYYDKKKYGVGLVFTIIYLEN